MTIKTDQSAGGGAVSHSELVDYLLGDGPAPDGGAVVDIGTTPEGSSISGQEEISRAAAAAGEAVLLSAAHSLASHPEIGLPMQLALQSGKPPELRTAWRRVSTQYDLLVASSPDSEAEQNRPHRTATERILGSLARGGTVRAIAPKLQEEGLIADKEEIYSIWVELADGLEGFVSPEFKNRPAYRRELEMVRFDEAFHEAPPSVLVKALLRIAGTSPEVAAATADFFEPETTAAAGDRNLRRGIALLGDMSQLAYRAIRASTFDDDPATLKYLQRELEQERLAFEWITGVGPNGLQKAQSYGDFLAGLKRQGGPSAAYIVRSGLQRVLKFYVQRHSIDVSKLMTAIGRPPVKVPALAVSPLSLRMTTRQKEQAIAIMSPEAGA